MACKPQKNGLLLFVAKVTPEDGMSWLVFDCRIEGNSASLGRLDEKEYCLFGDGFE